EDALLIALALPDERELALLLRAALADEPPERAAALSSATRERLAALRGRAVADAELEQARSLGCELVHWRSERYPAPLRELAVPPAVLWLRGAGPWPPPHPITIVGARASTGRGRAFARDLASEIAERGGAVVSGLAIGIDQAAHEGAVAVPGPSYAVLACGLDQVYPPGARPLAQEVERHG